MKRTAVAASALSSLAAIAILSFYCGKKFVMEPKKGAEKGVKPKKGSGRFIGQQSADKST